MNGAEFDTKTPTFGRKSRGATAGMARKHCERCGRTIPNRARSPYCTECFPEGVRASAAARRKARRDQVRRERQYQVLSTKGHYRGP